MQQFHVAVVLLDKDLICDIMFVNHYRLRILFMTAVGLLGEGE